MIGDRTPLLELQGISASYGPVDVLHDVSIAVYPGEIVTLLGSNGAGKSTTLMCASGIRPATSGSIRLGGEDVTTVPAHIRVARGLSQVPEGRRIFPRLTVRENLLLGGYLVDNAAALSTREERAYTLFPRLRERRDQFGGTLSGGEQQMLSLARALMAQPKVLLLDEPSMGVAPILVKLIFDTIKTLRNEGLTILLVEQNANAALDLSDRAYVIETGKIVLSGKSSEMKSDPRVLSTYLGGEVR
jgi:branched-chain amino acid transport system ATP-binding protein